MVSGRGSISSCFRISFETPSLTISQRSSLCTATRRFRMGESLLCELNVDGGAHVAVHSQRSTHRAWPPSFRELQASGRGYTPLSRPKPSWPYVFFSSSASIDMDSAGPVEDHTRQASEPPKKAPLSHIRYSRQGHDFKSVYCHRRRNHVVSLATPLHTAAEAPHAAHSPAHLLRSRQGIRHQRSMPVEEKPRTSNPKLEHKAPQAARRRKQRVEIETDARKRGLKAPRPPDGARQLSP